MPKRPAKVEEVNDAVAAEFADFDDGPANVVEVVTPEIVDTPDAPLEDSSKQQKIEVLS